MTQTFRYETNHPILQKHLDLLSKIDYERVMCVCYDEEKNDFFITECCDEWFTYHLTKEDCVELSQLFKEIAEVLNT